MLFQFWKLLTLRDPAVQLVTIAPGLTRGSFFNHSFGELAVLAPVTP